MIPETIKCKQVLWEKISQHYEQLVRDTTKMVREAALADVVVETAEDWTKRGGEAEHNLWCCPTLSLYLAEGESHAVMVQAVGTASVLLSAQGIVAEWSVRNSPEYGTRTHTATVTAPEALKGAYFTITGNLKDAACLKVPNGEPRTVTVQDYDYVCPDDPRYAAMVAAAKGTT